MTNKKIAMVVGMYDTVPPTLDPAAALQISAMNSLIFLAATRGHDVTAYAPESSALIEHTCRVAEKYGWHCTVANEGKTLHIADTSGHQGVIRLRGPEGMLPYGIGSDMDTKLRYETALNHLLIEDHRKNPYDVINVNYMFEEPFDQLVRALPSDVCGKLVATVHGLHISRQYESYRCPVIAISKSQADQLKEQGAEVLGVARHGIDEKSCGFTKESAGYLCFIGRMTPDKGPHLAIAAAKSAKKPLLIASKIQDWERKYFEEQILPHVTVTDEKFLDKYKTPEALKAAISALPGDPPIIFVGSVFPDQKQTLYGNAYATLFPVTWPEPFGLVRAESVAHGTYLISIGQYGKTKCGAVGEQIEDGCAGVALHVPHHDDRKEMEKAATSQLADALSALDARIREEGEANVRRSVRDTFEEHCTLTQHAANLDACYDRLRVRNQKVEVFKAVRTRPLTPPFIGSA